jgi:hypothetical protein
LPERRWVKEVLDLTPINVFTKVSPVPPVDGGDCFALTLVVESIVCTGKIAMVTTPFLHNGAAAVKLF